MILTRKTKVLAGKKPSQCHFVHLECHKNCPGIELAPSSSNSTVNTFHIGYEKKNHLMMYRAKLSVLKSIPKHINNMHGQLVEFLNGKPDST
jgi:hypothetical protein